MRKHKIVIILVERDGMALEDAIARVDEVREMILKSPLTEAEDILADELGLELDYLFDILL